MMESNCCLEQILDLRNQTGCSLMACKKAINYAADHDCCTPLGYLKAKGIAVATRNMTFEERVRHFSQIDLEE